MVALGYNRDGKGSIFTIKGMGGGTFFKLEGTSPSKKM